MCVCVCVCQVSHFPSFFKKITQPAPGSEQRLVLLLGKALQLLVRQLSILPEMSSVEDNVG